MIIQPLLWKSMRLMEMKKMETMKRMEISKKLMNKLISLLFNLFHSCLQINSFLCMFFFSSLKLIRISLSYFI